MAAFSASDVAFEGFRITRERPLWVLGWAGLYLAVAVVSLLVLGALAGTALSDLQSAMRGSNPDPNAIMAVYARLAPAYSILFPLTLVLYAVQVCAIYRAALRPQEPSFLGMRLGGDELRVLVVTVAVLLLLGIVYFVGAMVLILVAVGIGAAGGEGAGVVVGIVLGIALLCALIYFLVRLSFATVMTFAQKDFRVFESWGATKGHFWPLLGAYALAFIFAIIVSLLFLMIGGAILFGGAASLGQSFPEVMASAGDPTRMFQVLGPLAVLYLVLNAIASVASQVILSAPPAAAWRQISGQESVFA